MALSIFWSLTSGMLTISYGFSIYMMSFSGANISKHITLCIGNDVFVIIFSSELLVLNLVLDWRHTVYTP